MEIDRNESNVAGLGITTSNKRSSIIQTLTANDVVFWGADALVTVVLALFIVSSIKDATVLNVGIAFTINRAVGALAAIPLGRWFDKHKGYLDEVTAVTIACFITGGLYILLSYATHVWQLYTVMFFLGISYAIDLSAWRILFYSHIRGEGFGQTVGVYQTIYSLGVALFMALGGFAGERLGYGNVLLIGGSLMMIGSSLPLLIRTYFTPK